MGSRSLKAETAQSRSEVVLRQVRNVQLMEMHLPEAILGMMGGRPLAGPPARPLQRC